MTPQVSALTAGFAEFAGRGCFGHTCVSLHTELK